MQHCPIISERIVLAIMKEMGVSRDNVLNGSGKSGPQARQVLIHIHSRHLGVSAIELAAELGVHKSTINRSIQKAANTVQLAKCSANVWVLYKREALPVFFESDHGPDAVFDFLKSKMSQRRNAARPKQISFQKIAIAFDNVGARCLERALDRLIAENRIHQVPMGGYALNN